MAILTLMFVKKVSKSKVRYITHTCFTLNLASVGLSYLHGCMVAGNHIKMGLLQPFVPHKQFPKYAVRSLPTNREIFEIFAIFENFFLFFFSFFSFGA